MSEGVREGGREGVNYTIPTATMTHDTYVPRTDTDVVRFTMPYELFATQV